MPEGHEHVLHMGTERNRNTDQTQNDAGNMSDLVSALAGVLQEFQRTQGTAVQLVVLPWRATHAEALDMLGSTVTAATRELDVKIFSAMALSLKAIFGRLQLAVAVVAVEAVEVVEAVVLSLVVEAVLDVVAMVVVEMLKVSPVNDGTYPALMH
jgi:hypothetical protein